MRGGKRSPGQRYAVVLSGRQRLAVRPFNIMCGYYAKLAVLLPRTPSPRPAARIAQYTLCRAPPRCGAGCGRRPWRRLPSWSSSANGNSVVGLMASA
ncbi:hypothetical protein [Serratia symbiotica]|uniref:Uncharacterized protein n=1 Tax=Serratia symbiotica TaxID=138074 RepID=A0A7D5NKZ3_9GAMM|nr:hypothetical protein [Serratia symbiotica]MBQ0956336.1 hypothetical protein [Serratia symbiotica]QLH62805.1 hypothetical protein SYMBAF_07475 [Serratia symbiotica]QLH62811.1 hypothetical protein SYMBAF_07525 [Serratia symbiotica]QTP15495.1 hypothetical protein GPZ83_0006300 [Serratia symbiotica]